MNHTLSPLYTHKARSLCDGGACATADIFAICGYLDVPHRQRTPVTEGGVNHGQNTNTPSLARACALAESLRNDGVKAGSAVFVTTPSRHEWKDPRAFATATLEAANGLEGEAKQTVMYSYDSTAQATACPLACACLYIASCVNVDNP